MTIFYSPELVANKKKNIICDINVVITWIFVFLLLCFHLKSNASSKNAWQYDAQLYSIKLPLPFKILIYYGLTQKKMIEDVSINNVQKSSTIYIYMYSANSEWTMPLTLYRKYFFQQPLLVGITQVCPMVAFAWLADLPGRRSSSLRPASTSRLLVPPVRFSTVGSGAYSYTVAGPRVRNALPEETTLAQSLTNFCQRRGFSDSHTLTTWPHHLICHLSNHLLTVLTLK